MRVLIAEDDAVIRRLLESFLSRWGYEVVTALDGGRAWEILQGEEAPRLALLDWVMPVREGPDICRALRSRRSETYTYVLLLTSRDDRRDVLEGLESGADDYLTKPFHPEELRARLRAGTRILDLENSLLEAREVLRFKALHDPLTELWNHSAILERLEQELARSRREKSSLGVILLDVDHFKNINDVHGHVAGDQVLQEISRRMLSSVRSYDGVGRYGGEEFMVLLPSCDGAASREKAEQIRSAIAEWPIQTTEGQVHATVSLGVLASVSWPQADPVVVLRAADSALYQAKAAGRNCTVVAEPQESLGMRGHSEDFLAVLAPNSHN